MNIGRYRWFPKRTAYRNDYCLNCRAPTLAERIRTFDVAYLYFIPILPLGIWQHWHCLECRNDPHQRVNTALWAKIAGAVVWAAFCFVLFMIPVDEEELVGMWIGRLVFFGLFVYFVYLSMTHQPERSLNEYLSEVPALEGDECLFCGGLLWGQPQQCEQCHIYQL